MEIILQNGEEHLASTETVVLTLITIDMQVSVARRNYKCDVIAKVWCRYSRSTTSVISGDVLFAFDCQECSSHICFRSCLKSTDYVTNMEGKCNY